MKADEALKKKAVPKAAPAKKGKDAKEGGEEDENAVKDGEVNETV